MKVRNLIAALSKCDPEAEVLAGSHTLPHDAANAGNCESAIGIWPVIDVDQGTFPRGAPYDGGSTKWVSIVVSDCWGVPETFFVVRDANIELLRSDDSRGSR